MNITERRITVRELTESYTDSGDAGVTALTVYNRILIRRKK